MTHRLTDLLPVLTEALDLAEEATCVPEADDDRHLAIRDRVRAIREGVSAAFVEDDRRAHRASPPPAPTSGAGLTPGLKFALAQWRESVHEYERNGAALSGPDYALLHELTKVLADDDRGAAPHASAPEAPVESMESDRHKLEAVCEVFGLVSRAPLADLVASARYLDDDYRKLCRERNEDPASFAAAPPVRTVTAPVTVATVWQMLDDHRVRAGTHVIACRTALGTECRYRRDPLGFVQEMVVGGGIMATWRTVAMHEGDPAAMLPVILVASTPITEETTP